MNKPAAIDANTGEIVVFDPGKTKRVDAKADAVIKYAREVRDWPTLESAVDAKIEQQIEFVDWWGKNVSVRESPGRNGNKSGADLRSISRESAEELTGITHQQVSKWRKRLRDVPKYRAALYGAAYAKAMGQSDTEGGIDNHRAQGTGENEWYTPAEYVERARALMGNIDLDPASSDVAQKIVQATLFYSKDDDGLTKDWSGKVWLNPPYAQPAIHHFAEKMVEQYTSGNVSEAVMLTHNYTDTAWFHLANSAASALCFTRGRIGFVSPEGERAAPTQGQTFFYYGRRPDAFRSAFESVGFVR